MPFMAFAPKIVVFNRNGVTGEIVDVYSKLDYNKNN
jgi:hypothetical protein